MYLFDEGFISRLNTAFSVLKPRPSPIEAVPKRQKTAGGRPRRRHERPLPTAAATAGLRRRRHRTYIPVLHAN